MLVQFSACKNESARPSSRSVGWYPFDPSAARLRSGITLIPWPLSVSQAYFRRLTIRISLTLAVREKAVALLRIRFSLQILGVGFIAWSVWHLHDIPRSNRIHTGVPPAASDPVDLRKAARRQPVQSASKGIATSVASWSSRLRREATAQRKSSIKENTRLPIHSSVAHHGTSCRSAMK